MRNKLKTPYPIPEGFPPKLEYVFLGQRQFLCRVEKRNWNAPNSRLIRNSESTPNKRRFIYPPPTDNRGAMGGFGSPGTSDSFAPHFGLTGPLLSLYWDRSDVAMEKACVYSASWRQRCLGWRHDPLAAHTHIQSRARTPPTNLILTMFRFDLSKDYDKVSNRDITKQNI